MAELKLSDEQFNTLVNRICAHGWIPTNGALPTDNLQHVLICDASGEVCEGSYDSEKQCWWGSSLNWMIPDDGIVAWMPMPEPYKEDE
jgi:hypothetical protein